MNIRDSPIGKKRAIWRLDIIPQSSYFSMAYTGSQGVCPPNGGVAEWLKAAVLKTVERLRVPGVRIPPPPPH